MILCPLPVQSVAVYGQRRGRCRYRLAGPGHRRDEGGHGIETLAEVIDAFLIVSEEFRAEVAVTDAYLAGDVHLAFHDVECPFALLGVEEIDAKSRYDGPAVALLLPVDGKGVEVVVLEVHHRVELVHESFAHPCLGVLAYGRTCIPSPRLVACQVVVLADG